MNSYPGCGAAQAISVITRVFAVLWESDAPLIRGRHTVFLFVPAKAGTQCSKF